MKPPILREHPDWGRFTVDLCPERGGLFKPWVLVFNWGHCIKVHQMHMFGNQWREWVCDDEFSAQAVIDHIYTPRRVKFWRWLKGYFGR